MKTTKKVRIAGFVLLGIGMILIILGTVVFKSPNGWGLNFGFFVPGVLLIASSIFMIVASFIADAVKSVSNGIPNLVENVSNKIVQARDALKYKVCPYCGYKNTIKNGRCESCGGAMK